MDLGAYPGGSTDPDPDPEHLNHPKVDFLVYESCVSAGLCSYLRAQRSLPGRESSWRDR